MIAPIHQGHRVNRRRVREVDFEQRVPAFCGGSDGGVEGVDRPLVGAEPGAAVLVGLLDRAEEAGVLAFVAEVGERDVLSVGPGVEYREQVGMGAGAGGVVLAARPYR